MELITKRKNNLIVNLIIMAVLTVSFINEPKHVQATENFSFESNLADHKIESAKINREESLRAFFKKYDSPLEHNAQTFINVADKYGMDYRLLPAISGVESTYCKQIIEGTYNCYGWGIYGNNVIAFDSYDTGIEEVGKGIFEGYIVKGADSVEEIAPIYNPNTPLHWGGKVRYIMSQIG